MLKRLIFFFSIIWSLVGYSQPSLSPFSVIYPCSDDDGWIIGGLSSINMEYRTDSVFSSIDIVKEANVVSHSFSNILVLDSLGRLYGRGSNIYGELGNGDTLPRSEFYLAGLATKKWTKS